MDPLLLHAVRGVLVAAELHRVAPAAEDGPAVSEVGDVEGLAPHKRCEGRGARVVQGIVCHCPAVFPVRREEPPPLFSDRAEMRARGSAGNGALHCGRM